MQSPLCLDCLNKETCLATCAAWDALYKIYEEQCEKDKTILIHNLAKQMGIHDAKPDRKLKVIAKKLINHFPGELGFIREYGIKVGYVVSPERKQGEKTIYADCRKVTAGAYQAYLPFDFIITFYERNTGLLNENQLKLLMLHELKHIAIGVRGLKIRPHDIEDFSEILETYGLDWNSYGKELPDILEGE